MCSNVMHIVCMLMSVCIHPVFAKTNVCVYVCVHVVLYVCVSVCVHVYMCVCVRVEGWSLESTGVRVSFPFLSHLSLSPCLFFLVLGCFGTETAWAGKGMCVCVCVCVRVSVC